MLKQIKRILGLVLSGSVLLTSFATPVLADESYAVEAAETSEELPEPYADQSEAANGLPEYAPDENEIEAQYDEPEYLDGGAEETVSLASTLYYTYGPLTYTITSSNEITITDCETSATSVDIPSEIDGIPVTSIGDSAFSGCNSLTSIVVPGSVKDIGENAFSKCISLKEAILEEGIETIGIRAFSECKGLEKASLPSSLKSIGIYAFYVCSSLKEINIPSGKIGVSAFDGCSELLSVTIGNGVTTIGGSAFSGCNSLTNINIPNSVTSIGYYAFNSCSSLTEITVSGDNANYSSYGGILFNKARTEIIRVPQQYSGTYNIPNTVETITSSAFSGCKSLTGVSIPSSVKEMGGSAFYSCSNLQSVSIAEGLDTLTDYAFSGCAV